VWRSGSLLLVAWKAPPTQLARTSSPQKENGAQHSPAGNGGGREGAGNGATEGGRPWWKERALVVGSAVMIRCGASCPHCRRERNGDPTSDRHHRPRHGRQLRPMRNGAKNSENTQWQDHSGCVAHPPNCWVCRPKASRRRTPRHEARGPHGNQKHDGGSHAVSHAAPAGPVAWEEP